MRPLCDGLRHLRAARRYSSHALLMASRVFAPAGLLIIPLLSGTCSDVSAGPAPSPPPDRITARMLVAPNALVGPGPSSLSWSPVGAVLAYVEPKEGRDLLWLYEPATGTRRMLLDPAKQIDPIDLATARWSPQGNALLLTGEKSLWVLDLQTGYLKALAEGSRITAGQFLPYGTAVSFVQDNDLYSVRIDDGGVRRLTFDSGETVFNGALDWFYTEEMATASPSRHTPGPPIARG